MNKRVNVKTMELPVIKRRIDIEMIQEIKDASTSACRADCIGALMTLYAVDDNVTRIDKSEFVRWMMSPQKGVVFENRVGRWKESVDSCTAMLKQILPLCNDHLLDETERATWVCMMLFGWTVSTSAEEKEGDRIVARFALNSRINEINSMISLTSTVRDEVQQFNDDVARQDTIVEDTYVEFVHFVAQKQLEVVESDRSLTDKVGTLRYLSGKMLNAASHLSSKKKRTGITDKQILEAMKTDNYTGHAKELVEDRMERKSRTMQRTQYNTVQSASADGVANEDEEDEEEDEEDDDDEENDQESDDEEDNDVVMDDRGFIPSV